MVQKTFTCNYQPLESLSTCRDVLECEKAIFNEIKDIETLTTFDGLAYIKCVNILGTKIKVSVMLSTQLTLGDVEVFKAIIKDNINDYLPEYIANYRYSYEVN